LTDIGFITSHALSWFASSMMLSTSSGRLISALWKIGIDVTAITTCMIVTRVERQREKQTAQT